MGAVVEHCRDVAAHAAESVLADDGEDDAGRADVLLRAAVDEVILGNIDRTGHDVGGHVGDERARDVEVLVDLGAVDGVVRGDVEVVEVRGNLESLRDIGVVLVLGAGDGIGVPDALGFLEGLAGPHAGVQVGGLLLQEVHRDIEELEGGAAAEEDDLVRVGNMEEFLPQGAALIHHGVPLLRAVGDAKDGHAGAAEILQGFDGVVDGNLREEAGACIENVNLFHF